MKYATIILTNLKTRMPTPAGVCSYVLCTITFTSQGVQDYQFACIRSGTVGQGRTCLLAWIDERYTTAKRPRKYPKTHSNLHIWWLMMKRWRSRSIDWRWIIYIKKQEWCERYHFASLQKLEFKCLLHTELSSLLRWFKSNILFQNMTADLNQKDCGGSCTHFWSTHQFADALKSHNIARGQSDILFQKPNSFTVYKKKREATQAVKAFFTLD
jgi:hypothetical protein